MLYETKPNTLLVFSDQHNSCDLGCYGNGDVMLIISWSDGTTFLPGIISNLWYREMSHIILAINVADMPEWIASRPDVINDLHFYTKVHMGVPVKVK
jgi:D-arabinose 5-phosphate isomerase GutQ